MHEEAVEILDYIPIRSNPTEQEYVRHLWSAFSALDANNAHPFLVMPIHLLFMLSLQWKLMRVARMYSDHCNLAFHLIGGKKKEIILGSSCSVFDMSTLNERTMPDIFRLIGVTDQEIKAIKSLVDYRNESLAHANGGIERSVENKISEYLTALRLVQSHLEAMNDTLVDGWLNEMEQGDDMVQFIETRLHDSLLCRADFRTGMLNSHFGRIIE